MSRVLDALPRLPIDHHAIASTFVQLAQHLLTILSQGNRLPVPPRDLWQPALKTMQDNPKLLLKTVEAPVGRALRWILAQAGEDQKHRARIAEQIEQLFKTARLTAAGSRWLEQTFSSVLPKEAASVWLAGCGEGYEVKWLQERYPNARLTLIDMDDSALAIAKQTIADRNIKNCEIVYADLKNRSDLPKAAPELVIYLHPFVIEHATYTQAAQAIVRTKSSAEVNAIAEAVVGSPQGMATLDVLRKSLAPDGLLMASTMDGLESLAILRDGPSGATTYKNPFPIKIMSTLLIESRHPPLLAPRNFQYIHCWSESRPLT